MKKKLIILFMLFASLQNFAQPWQSQNRTINGFTNIYDNTAGNWVLNSENADFWEYTYSGTYDLNYGNGIYEYQNYRPLSAIISNIGATKISKIEINKYGGRMTIGSQLWAGCDQQGNYLQSFPISTPERTGKFTNFNFSVFNNPTCYNTEDWHFTNNQDVFALIPQTLTPVAGQEFVGSTRLLLCMLDEHPNKNVAVKKTSCPGAIGCDLQQQGCAPIPKNIGTIYFKMRFYKACNRPAPTLAGASTAPNSGMTLLYSAPQQAYGQYEAEIVFKTANYPAEGSNAPNPSIGYQRKTFSINSGLGGVTFDNLASGQNYKIRARAICTNGSKGTWGEPQDFTTNLPKCHDKGSLSTTNAPLYFNWTAGAVFDFKKLVNGTGTVEIQEKVNGSWTNVSGNTYKISADLNASAVVTKEFKIILNNNGTKCEVSDKIFLDFYPIKNVIQIKNTSRTPKNQDLIFYGIPNKLIDEVDVIKIFPVNECGNPTTIPYTVRAIFGVSNSRLANEGFVMNGNQSSIVDAVFRENARTACVRDNLDDNNFTSSAYRWHGFRFAYPHYSAQNENRDIPRYLYTSKYVGNMYTFYSYINRQTNATKTYEFKIAVRKINNPLKLKLYGDATSRFVDMPGIFARTQSDLVMDKHTLGAGQTGQEPTWYVAPLDKQDLLLTADSDTGIQHSMSYLFNASVEPRSKANPRTIMRPIAGCPKIIFPTGVTLGLPPAAEGSINFNDPTMLSCSGSNATFQADVVNGTLYCKAFCMTNIEPCATAARIATSQVNDIIFNATFPNPFTSELNIKFTAVGGQEAYFEVFDLTGNQMYNSKVQKLEEGGFVQETLDTSSWRKGIYIVKTFAGNGESSTEKVVKQ